MIYYFEIFESHRRDWDCVYYPLGIRNCGWHICREFIENKEIYENGRVDKTWDVM